MAAVNSKKFRLRVVADTSVILLSAAFPHFGLLPMFIFPFVILLALWFYLRTSGENFQSIGFSFKRITAQSFLIGGFLGIGYAAVAWYGIAPLIKAAGFSKADLSDFDYLKGNPRALVQLLILAWLLVIPFEEILFRGFIFTRIKKWLDGHASAFAVAALATSILFAAYHYQEGLGAVLQIFIFAVFQMWLYKRFNGNLWYLIFFHAFYDTAILTALFAGYA